MTHLQFITPDDAPSKDRDLLAGLVARHGEASAMVRTMAHHPLGAGLPGPLPCYENA